MKIECVYGCTAVSLSSRESNSVGVSGNFIVVLDFGLADISSFGDRHMLIISLVLVSTCCSCSSSPSLPTKLEIKSPIKEREWSLPWLDRELYVESKWFMAGLAFILRCLRELQPMSWLGARQKPARALSSTQRLLNFSLRSRKHNLISGGRFKICY